jgi:hypothetical protein
MVTLDDVVSFLPLCCRTSHLAGFTGFLIITPMRHLTLMAFYSNKILIFCKIAPKPGRNCEDKHFNPLQRLLLRLN